MENKPSPAPLHLLVGPVLLSVLMFAGIIHTAVVVRLLTEHGPWITYLWGPVATWATWRVWIGARRTNQ